MRRLNLFWRSKKEWTTEKNNILVIADDAPPVAKASYEEYLKQIKEMIELYGEDDDNEEIDDGD